MVKRLLVNMTMSIIFIITSNNYLSWVRTYDLCVVTELTHGTLSKHTYESTFKYIHVLTCSILFIPKCLISLAVDVYDCPLRHLRFDFDINSFCDITV